MSFITVVSGLPRSGTSLMMQMLRASGMDVLTDGVREADASNPRGYFEYDPVRRTARDAAWVPRAEGKAVKVIHALLGNLPDGHEYRVILMRRPIEEVLRSQRQMLDRAPEIPEERLGRVFLQQLRQAEQWMSSRPQFRVLPMEYHDCVHRPAEAAAAVRDFLELDLDAAAMQAAVDPALHRIRG